MNRSTPAQNRKLTAQQPESWAQTADAAQGPLVERLAEGLQGAETERYVVTSVWEQMARAILPLVEAHAAAEVEAAVSVVRAERDEAREEVRARDDDAALEVERVKRGARELGRILDRTLNEALDISGRQDVIDEDGDGDWGVVWETLAELRPRAEAAESEVRALREKVAKVEALVESQHRPSTDDPLSLITWTYCGCGVREVRTMSDGGPSLAPAEYPCAALRDLRSALSDPTTPDQKGGRRAVEHRRHLLREVPRRHLLRGRGDGRVTDHETKYRDLVAGLEALAGEWERDWAAYDGTKDVGQGARKGAAVRLRALLASSPAEREGEGRVDPVESGFYHPPRPAPVSSGEAGDRISDHPFSPDFIPGCGECGEPMQRHTHTEVLPDLSATPFTGEPVTIAPVTPITQGGEQP